MQWCKSKGFPPAQKWAWDRSENAYKEYSNSEATKNTMVKKKSTDVKSNVLRVLEDIKNRVENPDCDEVIDEWAEALDSMLDEMKNNDQFGTEASTDPRGDFRNGEWSIFEMEQWK